MAGKPLEKLWPAALGWLFPAVLALLVLGLWEAIVAFRHIPPYILPAPSQIAETLVRDWGVLGPSLGFTLGITAASLALSVAGGVALAMLFTQSRVIARSLFPYAVILQVTPIVAIAPLIIIWVNNTVAALLICATIVAFFPILANTTLGLNSTDRNLRALFQLYGASRGQTLFHLQIPSALPSFFAGLKVSGGLALIGAVVAEFVAGAGGRESGLAFRILEAGYRLDIPRMFAALFLISSTGIVIYAVLAGASMMALGYWHESALKDQD